MMLSEMAKEYRENLRGLKTRAELVEGLARREKNAARRKMLYWRARQLRQMLADGRSAVCEMEGRYDGR